ncbi:BRO1-like domain-containing protein [Chlamydoabsidia padenii]|nr:BRO1-like domain-containing protein [Chlamydoabsidia padenii]
MSSSQIPLISIPFKRTDDIDWTLPLKRYIAQQYQDDPEKYTQETYALNRLRQDIRGAGKDMTGRDLLYRYFGQLELLDLRFPVDEKHVKILFTWYDAFTGKPTSQYSLAYEKASVIFNIAATLSAIAAVQNRAEPDGRKRAFHFLQASAGMLEYINENFLHAPSLDLGRETIHLLAELMLVQAQECFLENSMREKKKDGLIAKLASHTVWVYGNLVDEIQEATSGRGVTIDRAWLSVCMVKHKYYQGVAQQYKAAACEAEGLYGEQVARLGVAEQVAKDGSGKLATTLIHQVAATATTTSAATASTPATTTHANGTLPADTGVVLQELCKALAATCGEKKTAASRDNDMIYHEHVPQDSILTPIDRLKAVQAIPMAELYGGSSAGSGTNEQMTKVIGPDIFAKLIPLSVHESASLYSEEQAKLVRAETEKCDLAKAELKASLEYMKLPGSLDKFKAGVDGATKGREMETAMAPPSDVVALADDIAAQENSGKGIRSTMDQLESLKTKARKALDDIGLKLDQETRECESMRVKYGDLWTQAPSGSLTTNFRQDLRNHRQSLESGTQSDSTLYQRHEEIKKDVEILRQGGRNGQMERVFAEHLTMVLEHDSKKGAGENSLLDLDMSSSVNAAKLSAEKAQQVESIIDKLYKLEKDRSETLQDLKERTRQDDISQLLLLNKKSNAEQHLFMSELEKYRPHQQRIAATLHQQQQLIQELTTAFKSLMAGEEAQQLQSRWDKVDRQKRQLVEQYRRTRDTYFDVKDGLGKGIQFYTSLNEAINALTRNCQMFVDDRGRERQRMVDDLDATQSSREQALLKDRLNMYTASAPDVSQLMNRTAQMSLDGSPTPPAVLRSQPALSGSTSSSSSSYGYNQAATTTPPPPPPVPQQYSQFTNPLPTSSTPQQTMYGASRQQQPDYGSGQIYMNPSPSVSYQQQQQPGTFQAGPPVPPSPYNVPPSGYHQQQPPSFPYQQQPTPPTWQPQTQQPYQQTFQQQQQHYYQAPQQYQPNQPGQQHYPPQQPYHNTNNNGSLMD